jgi:hypothetical protein
MRLRGGRLGGLTACELERRERADQLRMEEAHVSLCFGEQRLFVLGLQDFPASALHDGCHPAVKTAYVSWLFPLAASA